MPAFLNEPLTASFLFMISISTRPASNSHFLFSFPSVLLLFYFGGGGRAGLCCPLPTPSSPSTCLLPAPDSVTRGTALFPHLATRSPGTPSRWRSRYYGKGRDGRLDFQNSGPALEE